MGNEEMVFGELMQFGSTVQRKKRENGKRVFNL